MPWKHRYWVLGVVCSATTLCYLDRMVMATAIPFIAKDLQLSGTAMGAVLGAFFVGYALMQIPGGVLSDRLGPRRALTASIACFSIMTALTATVRGLVSMLTVRALFGLGEGPYPAAAAKIISNWFPADELGRATGFQLAATYLGATLAPLFTVGIVMHLGWRAVFYTLFVPGGLLAWILWCVVRDRPEAEPKVARAALPESSDSTFRSTASAGLPAVLRNPAVLWCAASLLLWNVAGWGLLNWLPTYLLQARGFAPGKMGFLAALTNLAGAFGFLLGGHLTDRYFEQKLRILLVASLLLGALFTYFAAVAPSGEWAVLHLMVVFLISGAGNTALLTLPLVLVPKEATGTAFGIVNTAGQIAGVVSPLIIGYLLDLTHGNFEIMLYCLVLMTLLAIYPASHIRQRPSVEAAATGAAE